jgi:CBS domain-containing protein
MRRDIPVVLPQTPLPEVLQKLLQAEALHAVVVDEQTRLLGLVTGSSLLRALARTTDVAEQATAEKRTLEQRGTISARPLRAAIKQ